MRRAVLIGHSDGGSIAAIHAGAVQRCTRVLGVVLIAAHFFVEDLNIASIRRDQGDLRARRPARAAGALSSRRRCGVPWLERRLARSAVPRVRHHRATSARIRVPVLALQGADDPYGTPEQLRVLERAASCPVETRLIAGARHSPHLEAKDATLAAIVPFVRSVLMEAAA